MVEWNGIFRLFRFSGILGQPHEVHTKFRKEIPENVCSIRSTTRNFRKFWSNGKRPCCSRNFFFLTVADVSEVQETLWNVWPQNVLFFFKQLFSIQTQNQHNIPSAIFVCIFYFQFSNSLCREARSSNLWCQRGFLAPPNYKKNRINPHYEHRND